MVSTVGITDTIKSLSDLQNRCNLYQAEDENFFNEWFTDLPQLNPEE